LTPKVGPNFEFTELVIMEESTPILRLLPALAAAALISACASAPSSKDHRDLPPQKAEAQAERENAENNLAYAKDQASMWLESQQDRCATAEVADHEACSAQAKAAYESQIAEAQRRYAEICRKADDQLRAADASQNR
jgi:hypothetical protein